MLSATSKPWIRASTQSLLISVLIFHGASSAKAQGDKSREFFLEEYQPFARKLRDFYTNVHVKLITTHHNSAVGDVLQVDAVEMKYDAKNAMAISNAAFKNQKTRETVRAVKKRTYCENPYYSFAVTSNEKDENVVSDLKINESPAKSVMCSMCVPFGIPSRNQTFVEVAQDETVRIKAFSDSVWQGKPMKELALEYTNTHAGTKKPILVGISYFFDPNAGWACCGSRMPTDKEEFYYHKEADKEFADLTKTEHWVRGKLIRTEEITEVRHVAGFPEETFRMSSFGLPEPMGVPPIDHWATRWYLWFALAAVGVLVGGGIVVMLRRRYSKIPTAPEVKEGGS